LETNIFYYHVDHLGSANWITNADGDAVHTKQFRRLMNDKMAEIVAYIKKMHRNRIILLKNLPVSAKISTFAADFE